MTEKCVNCGRFMSPMQVGSSWAQNWRYCMDGTPELQDFVFQCAPCTERAGPLESNCANSGAYAGVFRGFKEVA